MILGLCLTIGLLGAPAVAAPDARLILAELEAFDTQIAALDAQLTTLEATLASAEAAHTTALAQAEEAERTMEARGAGAATLLEGLYRLHRYGVLRLLFGAEDAVNLRRRTSYLRAILAAEEARAVEFAGLATQRREAAAGAAAAQASTTQLRDSLRVQRESLAAERARRRALVGDIRREPALAGRAVTETAEARRELQSSVMAREATVPASVAAPTTADFRAERGRLPRPVNGRLLRAYGAWTDELSGARAHNAGIDWIAEPGSSFRAVFAGVVTRAGYVRGYGQMVMLQHGSFTTLYAHANGLRVVVDQVVKAGDALGTVGTTGLPVEGSPQLHFEVRYNGTPQDPAEWLAP